MNFSQFNLADETRGDFPLLQKFGLNNNKDERIIYLDYAATSQKPLQVIQTLEQYYLTRNANVHRGAHRLSAQATEAFESARQITSNFVNAFSSNEIVFTRNATEGINLVARTWGDVTLGKGDEILVSLMEHHSNIVPWQMLSKRTGCTIHYVGLNEFGEFDFEDYRRKLNKQTKLVSLVHISNTLGSCNPIGDVVKLAKKFDSMVLLDACQSLAHKPINVQSLGVDFLVGSSHKICGPTGVGFLWARENILEEIPPFLGGGEMIDDVYLDHSTWADLPQKFEAGTPPIGEAIAMGKAINYLQEIGFDKIQSWESTLIEYLINKLEAIDSVSILGPPLNRQPSRGALATFIVNGVHSDDLASLLDIEGICIRSGHHCCQPLHRHYGISSSARASISFTTNKYEIDIFIEELLSAISFLKKNS